MKPAEAMNDETLAEYPQEVTSFAFVNQNKSNDMRNYSFLSFRRNVVFFRFSQISLPRAFKAMIFRPR